MECIKPILNRLSELQSVNRRIQEDAVLRGSLEYHGISLWSCEQQLLWEQTGRASVKKRIGSTAALFCARCVACVSLTWLIIRMRVSKSRIFIYGIDLVDSPYAGDARIARIYRFLHERKIGYGEILHTTFSRSFFANFLRRRRAAFYLGIAYASSTGRASRPEFDRLVSDRLNVAASRPRSIAFIRRVLWLTGARTILAIDDTRYYYPLMIAARECGIPFYAFQHGRFNPFMPGWAQYGIDPAACPFPDAVFVWSEYWRFALMRISPPAALHADRIRISGKPSIGTDTDALLAPPIDDGVMSFLIPHEDILPEAEILDFIARILAMPDTRVIYKLRRGRPTPSFIRHFKSASRFECRFDISPDDWSRVDAVLGAYSTFLYEAAACGRPVGVLETSVTQASDLVLGGFAEAVCLSTLSSDASRVARTPWGVVCARREAFRCQASFNDALSAIMPT